MQRRPQSRFKPTTFLLWGLTAEVYKSLRTTAAIPQILDDCLFEITCESKKNEWTPLYPFITKPSVKSWDCTGQLPGGNVCNLKWAAGQCFKKPADTAKLFPRDKWKIHNTPERHWRCILLLCLEVIQCTSSLKSLNSQTSQSLSEATVWIHI